MGTLMAFFFCAAVVMLLFLLIRAEIAGSWNSRMYAIACREEGRAEWYMRWDIIDAICNPRHYNKWTTAQWVKYQKVLYGNPR